MKLIFTCVFLLNFASNAHAEIAARVLDVQGNAFSFIGKDIRTLKYGSKIFDLSEIMVEDGATVSVVNSQGHVFHINGGSLVKFYNGIVELKNGYLWVKSSDNRKGLFNTSNSIGQYAEGEFILSFDNISRKTQLLVLTGDVKFSNALEPNLNTNVTSGYFSLVEPKYENGLPRTPTKVGLKSYKQIKMVFNNFKEIQDSNFEKTMWGEKSPAQKQFGEKAKRSIASSPIASSPVPHHFKRGKVIHITTYASRGPASTSISPMKYYQEMTKKNAWKYRPLKTNKMAPIHYYGFKKHKKMKRAIASIPSLKKLSPLKKKISRVPAAIEKKQLIDEITKSGFANSLNSESKKIQRNSNEVNGLIDELKSYKQDYKKKY